MRLAQILSVKTLAPLLLVNGLLVTAVIGLAAMFSVDNAERARLGVLEGALLGEEHTAQVVLDLLDMQLAMADDPSAALSAFMDTRSSDLVLFSHTGLPLTNRVQAQDLARLLRQVDLRAAYDDWRLNDRRRFSLDNLDSVMGRRDEAAISATFQWLADPPRLVGYGRILAVSQARAEDLGRAGFALAAVAILVVLIGAVVLIAVMVTMTRRRLRRLVLAPMAEVAASLSRLSPDPSQQALPIPAGAAVEFRTLTEGYNRQLHEIRTAQHAAEERERDLDAVFRAMPGAILVLDAQRRVLRINPGATSLLGVAGTDAVGRPLREVAALRDPLDLRPLDLVPTSSCEAQLLRPDGMRLAVAVYLVERADGAGSVAVLQDLSEIRAVARQVRQVARFEATDQLVAGGIHDINNALAIVLAGGEMLRKRCTDDDLLEYVSAIANGAERAVSTLRRLQDFVRRGPAKSGPLSLPELLHRAHGLLSPGLPTTITFTLDASPETPGISGDADALLDAIANLVLNARDAITGSGTIRLHCGTCVLEADQGRRLGLRPGAYATLAVSDDGMGISSEIQAKLFSTYFTTKPVGKGNGLGLVSCLGIARQHHGTIAVASQPGQGTTFTIYVPVVAPVIENVPARRASTPMQGMKSMAVPGSTGPLMIVDDDPLVREACRAWFSEAGFMVDAAQHGEDALTRMGDIEPIALIADLDMPRLDGRQLIDRCRRRWEHLPCVLVTGAPDRQGLDAWALTHQVTVVAKPILMADLEQMVRQLIQESDRLVSH